MKFRCINFAAKSTRYSRGFQETLVFYHSCLSNGRLAEKSTRMRNNRKNAQTQPRTIGVGRAGAHAIGSRKSDESKALTRPYNIASDPAP